MYSDILANEVLKKTFFFPFALRRLTVDCKLQVILWWQEYCSQGSIISGLPEVNFYGIISHILFPLIDLLQLFAI